MVKKLNITMPNWFYELIEVRKGNLSRSEFICESMAKGMKLLQEENGDSKW